MLFPALAADKINVSTTRTIGIQCLNCSTAAIASTTTESDERLYRCNVCGSHDLRIWPRHAVDANGRRKPSDRKPDLAA